MCGFLKGDCLELQKFLPPTESPLVFAARRYGDLTSWHGTLGGTLVWGWESSLPNYPSPKFLRLFFIYLFVCLGRGRKRGRETSVCACLLHTAYRGLGLRPETQAWATPARALLNFLSTSPFHICAPPASLDGCGFYISVVVGLPFNLTSDCSERCLFYILVIILMLKVFSNVPFDFFFESFYSC